MTIEICHEMRMRLDIDSLRAFKTVLELGGVTRAAKKLNLTQSAVSHKLLRLEERIGRPILVRRDGVLAPTADGASLLGYADRLVALHDEAAAHFKSSTLAGDVRLGATEDAVCERLAAVMGAFRRLHPRVTLSIRVGQSLALEQDLRSGRLDLAILQAFVNDKAPGDVELWRDDLIWVRSVEHPVTSGSRLPFVSFDADCFYRRAATQALAESGRTLDVVLECPSADGVAAGVRHGLGVALLGRRRLQAGLVETRDGLPRFPPICHVVRPGGRLKPGLEASLIETIAGEMGEMT